ncbi:PilX N-terminal domain-containing pilus assembly protein [Metabacillus halosaccharovorans]|uniref:DUF7305 domain-containing protein n=1 Tax=Metabacillus halosaccharovorans TaxID=930124 RepID=UPI0034CF3112
MTVFKRIKNEESGFALVAVLIVLLIISLLGITLIGTSAANIKMSSVERDYQATYYIAESGTTYVLNELTKILGDIDATNENDFFTEINEKLVDIPDSYSGFEKSFGEQPKANLDIYKLSSSNTIQACGNAEEKQTQGYKIISEGEIGTRSRTVEKTFCVNWNTTGDGNSSIQLLDNTAVFSHNDIFLNSTINGHIGTNSTNQAAIEVDWSASLNGSIYKVAEAKNNIVKKPQHMNFEKTFINLPYPMNYKDIVEFPSFPEELPTARNLKIEGGPANDMTINNNAYFQNITVTSDRTLTIDVGNEDRVIRVNDLILNQGNIRITGSGKLTLYIENTFTITGGSKVNFNSSNGPEKLTIFYKGSSPIDTGGAVRLVGSLFAESADITIGGSAQITGNILTLGKKISINGAGSAANGLVFAPNAQVQLTGSGSVIGTVISDYFSINGGSWVTYKKINENILLPIFKQEVEEPDLTTGPIKELN